MCDSTQGKKTWAILLAKFLMANTIKKYALGTYTKLTHHASYHKQQRQVLCEGVLEVYPTDISAPLRSRAYPSCVRHEYQLDRQVRVPVGY